MNMKQIEIALKKILNDKTKIEIYCNQIQITTDYLTGMIATPLFNYLITLSNLQIATFCVNLEHGYIVVFVHSV